ncbi:MAG: aspartate kinase, partial [Oscillospiraceae bacterium]|nr:aspartate kinase [Oscillospiraceae bacterium]
MKRIVQKFGGSSVRDAKHLRNVASIIADSKRKGNAVIAVLSAQGDTTDELLRKACELSRYPSSRELDALMATGEQISVTLCAILLMEMGLPAISLNAWQVGICTDDIHGDARIEHIEMERILGELDAGKVVLVTGFQGVNPFGDITTLGRGGSDTSAVALAAAFQADRCEIYTDVDGVYTADPRIIPTAKKHDEINSDEMLDLALRGAQVLHSRSVELAKKYGVDIDVLSSLERGSGTKVIAKSIVHTPHLAGVTRNGG